MRLIDADELKQALGKSTVTIIGYGKAVILDEAYDIIDNAPTVDIKPFKNGELVLQTDKRPQGEWIVDITTREVVCSCCRQSRRDTRTTHIFFCNHCGADMRKEGNR